MLLTIVALAGNLRLSVAQPTSQPQGPSYSEFRIITERNIFNPRRYARNIPQPARPVTRSDSFTLVGTMAYEKGPFAFFEGSSPEYRKVVKVADNIAGYKITNIQYNSVKLAGASNEVQMAVGMQMRRDEDGPWHVASAAESYPSRPSANVASSGTGSAVNDTAPANPDAEPAAASGADSGPAANAGADDPVLKKLMQRREQEMNR